MADNVRCVTSNSNAVFAGGYQIGGVYKTTNMGINWVPTELIAAGIYSLATDGNYVLAGTYPWGILYTTNDGSNWYYTSLNNRTAYSLEVCGNYVFAGTWTYGVYRSTNHGLNWSQTTLDNRTVHAIAAYGSNVFAGTDYGVYFSTNNGINWVQTSLNNRLINELEIKGNSLFASGDTTIFLSTDNGFSWTQTFNQNYVRSLLAYQNYIFAGGGNNFYVSSNNGVSWISKNENLYGMIHDLCIHNNYIFAAAWEFYVYKRPLEQIVGLKPLSDQIPEKIYLFQNYPNPFNPITKIKFSLPHPSEGGAVNVKLVVYDVMGREVASLIPPLWGGQEGIQPGTYEVDWDASNYSSGIYYYTLSAGDPFYEPSGSKNRWSAQLMITKKMILLK